MTERMATKGKTTQDVIGRLAGRGEEALHRLTELPGGTKAVRAFNDLRQRVDELSRKMRGVDALEQRVAKLEKELAALKRAQKPAPKAPSRKAAS
jgi:uncharacterized small protein (DUF1192 family)